MIAILTNEGSLGIARMLSGGDLFLVYGAALVEEQLTDPYEVATSPTTVVRDGQGKEYGITFANSMKHVVRVVPCSGILPVQVSKGDATAMAVDFDFNTQLIDNDGLPVEIKYYTVCMLARRYHQYKALEYTTYHYGDHIWFGQNKDIYVCAAAEYTYSQGSPAPDQDTVHWVRVDPRTILEHPADRSYFSNPVYDTFVMHVTSYDDEMTMGNGIEFEYKVRVFLDNLNQSNLSKIERFAQGTEANGSLALTFMAALCEDLRKMRDMISPIA